MELTDDYGIYEIPAYREWIGKSIRELDIRAKYKVNILGIKNGDDLDLMPPAGYVFDKEQHLLVIGQRKDIEKILHKM